MEREVTDLATVQHPTLLNSNENPVEATISNSDYYIPFHSIETIDENELEMDDCDADSQATESLSDSRRNSKRLQIAPASTSFDPKRQKCQTPNRFYFEKVPNPAFRPVAARTPPPSMVPTSRRKSSIHTRERRTSSVDSLNVRFSDQLSESDESNSHTPPPPRSRKASRSTPSGIASNRSSYYDTNMNSKFVFSPLPEDCNLEFKHYQHHPGFHVKSKSLDTGLAGFMSITVDFDHKASSDDLIETPRELTSSNLPETTKLFIASTESEEESRRTTRSYTIDSRMTPSLLPFRNLSLHDKPV